MTRRVPLPGAPRHLQLAGPGGPVLVPSEPANELVQVPIRDKAQGAEPEISRVGMQPHDAAQIGERIFVGDERADTVTVLERDGAQAGRFRVARQPGGVAPAAGGRFAAVVTVRDRLLELFDAKTFRRVAVANAGVGPTHVVSDGDNRLYVTDTAGDALLVFRVEPELELIRRLAMPTSPYGIAIDTRRERLWVTLTGTNRVVKLWTNGPRTVANLPSVRQPDTIAVDEETGRAFVTGRFDGVVQLLDPADRAPRERTR